MRRCGAKDSWTTEGVDLNCYLVREFQAMAEIASLLGQDREALSCRRQAQDLWSKIDSVLWHEADGFYYDRNERTGKPVRVKSISGLLPLWLGLVPEAKAARLVKEHLLNPAEFWLEYPVAAWAKTEPDHGQDLTDWGCNWRGTTWIPTNYMLMHGLMRCGFSDIARDLAYKTFELAVSKNRTTREYYNAETGAGKGLETLSGPAAELPAWRLNREKAIRGGN